MGRADRTPPQISGRQKKNEISEPEILYLVFLSGGRSPKNYLNFSFRVAILKKRLKFLLSGGLTKKRPKPINNELAIIGPKEGHPFSMQRPEIPNFGPKMLFFVFHHGECPNKIRTKFFGRTSKFGGLKIGSAGAHPTISVCLALLKIDQSTKKSKINYDCHQIFNQPDLQQIMRLNIQQNNHTRFMSCCAT